MRFRPRAVEEENHRRRFDWRRIAPRHTPVRLLSLLKPVEAGELMLDGLRRYYLESLTQGRIEAWRKAAHAMIDLMADVEEAKIYRRDTLPPS